MSIINSIQVKVINSNDAVSYLVSSTVDSIHPKGHKHHHSKNMAHPEMSYSGIIYKFILYSNK